VPLGSGDYEARTPFVGFEELRGLGKVGPEQAASQRPTRLGGPLRGYPARSVEEAQGLELDPVGLGHDEEREEATGLAVGLRREEPPQEIERPREQAVAVGGG